MESILILMEWNLYLNNRYFLEFTLSLTWFSARGGERGQNLEHLNFFLYLLLIFLNVIVNLNIRYYLRMTFCKF